jgi:hypothetical protein
MVSSVVNCLRGRSSLPELSADNAELAAAADVRAFDAKLARCQRCFGTYAMSPRSARNVSSPSIV